MIRPLLLSLLSAAGGQSLPATERVAFPDDPSVLEVKRDFGAQGDGVADDTAALEAGLEASSNRRRAGGTKILFLPQGTYRVEALQVYCLD